MPCIGPGNRMQAADYQPQPTYSAAPLPPKSLLHFDTAADGGSVFTIRTPPGSDPKPLRSEAASLPSEHRASAPGGMRLKI